MVVTFYFAHQQQKGGNSDEDTEQRKDRTDLPEVQRVNSTLGGEEDQENQEEKEGE